MYPYLCALNVKWNAFDLSVVKSIKLEDNEKERYQVLKGDLLICEGGDVGRSAIWNSNEPIYFQNALHRVRFFGNIVADFYLYLFWCYKNYNWIDDICNGVTIKHLTQDKINALHLPLPPVAEQQRIVIEVKKWFVLIDQIEQIENNLQSTIKQTKSKFLDLAIHGKLVPQDPTDEPASKLLKRINPKAEITSDNGHYQKLPEGWCETTLKHVITIKSGCPINVRSCIQGHYPIYGGNGITGYTVDYNIKEPTIVIGRVGFYCGSVYLVKEKAWVSDNAFTTTIHKDISYKNTYTIFYSF